MSETKIKFELKEKINEKTCEEFFLKVNNYLIKNNYESIDVSYFVNRIYIFKLGYIDNILIDKIKIYYYGNEEKDLYLSLIGSEIHLIKKIEALKNE